MARLTDAEDVLEARRHDGKYQSLDGSSLAASPRLDTLRRHQSTGVGIGACLVR